MADISATKIYLRAAFTSLVGTTGQRVRVLLQVAKLGTAAATAQMYGARITFDQLSPG